MRSHDITNFTNLLAFMCITKTAFEKIYRNKHDTKQRKERYCLF